MQDTVGASNRKQLRIRIHRGPSADMRVESTYFRLVARRAHGVDLNEAEHGIRRQETRSEVETSRLHDSSALSIEAFAYLGEPITPEQDISAGKHATIAHVHGRAAQE